MSLSPYEIREIELFLEKNFGRKIYKNTGSGRYFVIQPRFFKSYYLINFIIRMVLEFKSLFVQSKPKKYPEILIVLFSGRDYTLIPSFDLPDISYSIYNSQLKTYIRADFQKVFENLSPENKRKFAFHMDLFKKAKPLLDE